MWVMYGLQNLNFVSLAIGRVCSKNGRKIILRSVGKIFVNVGLIMLREEDKVARAAQNPKFSWVKNKLSKDKCLKFN